MAYNQVGNINIVLCVEIRCAASTIGNWVAEREYAWFHPCLMFGTARLIADRKNDVSNLVAEWPTSATVGFRHS